MRIAIAPASFARYSEEPLNMLRQAGVEYVLNDKRRPLSEDELIQMVDGCAGLAVGNEAVTRKVMDAAPGLRVVARCGTTLENVDLAHAANRGIEIRNTPGGPTFACAELTIALMLNLLRQISFMDREVHGKVWKKRMGSLLYGKNVGIVGFGRVGRALAERLTSFGANLAFFDPHVEAASAAPLPCEKMEINDLMSWADIVSLHCSKPDHGGPVLDAGRLAHMRPGGFVVNVARGGLVDENALYGLLIAGHLAGAALDVFTKEPYDGPLQGMDNVVLTPHVGAHARESRIIMEIDTIQNMLEVLGG